MTTLDTPQTETAPETETAPKRPHPLSMAAHPTIWTVALALLIAVVMSLLPLPSFLRPFAFQEQGVWPTISAALLPKGRHKTLDEIRHEVTPPPKKSVHEDLSQLLAASPAPASPKAPEGAPDAADGGEQSADSAVQSPAQAQEHAEGSSQGEPPAAREDPAFWLATHSAPPLSSLGAGAKKSRDFNRIETFGAKLLTSDQEIEEVCFDPKESPDTCGKKSLEPFFDALAEVVSGKRAAPIRIAHFGNSLIASDFVAATIRRELSDRYGSGGQGFLLVDRPTRISGTFARTGKATEGWKTALLTDKGPRLNFGLTGARFVGGEEPAHPHPSVTFDAKGASAAEVAFLKKPKGGDIQVIADGALLTTIHTSDSAKGPGFEKVALKAGTKNLTLKVSQGSAELYGVTMENGLPGIVHDTFGLAGGTADVFLQADEEVFAGQLKARSPDLFIVMLGGNETYEMTRGWMSAEKAKKTVDGFIERLRENVPGASCLVASQLDAGIRSASGDITPRPHAVEVRDILRQSAKEHGCAFWDMFAFMGGEGSVSRWFAAGAMNEDLIHPRTKGAEVLGHALVSALERARLRRGAVAEDIRLDPPGIGRPERLNAFFGKLAALEEKKAQDAVSVVQIGASHTAAHFFTDEIRARMAEKFGGAGRGFVAAGKASNRLTAAGVERELKGTWKVADARDTEGKGLFGLTGIRAEGSKGASLAWKFGVGHKGDKKRQGVLSLHYLDGPSPEFAGEIALRLDGKEISPIRLGGSASPELKIHRLDVTGPSHALEVTNAGEGQIALFGASLDFAGPGIRWDALGLPGATAMLADNFDKAVYSAALADRRADLLVLFYGTNEAALEDLRPEDVRQHYGSLIDSFRAASSPDAACLIVGPTDRLDLKRGPSALAPSMDTAIAAIRDTAKAHGCAFWSSSRAMGGRRSMKRWQEAGLANKDGVHLLPKGYQILADALFDALMQEYGVWKAESAQEKDSRP